MRTPASSSELEVELRRTKSPVSARRRPGRVGGAEQWVGVTLRLYCCHASATPSSRML